MNRLLITILLALCFNISLVAQQGPKVVGYFDKHWLRVKKKEEATYFRTVVKQGPGKFLVQDFYVSGQAQMNPVICTDYEPRLKGEWNNTLYYENGKPKEEGLFKDELRSGEHKYWYESGAQYKLVLYEENEPKKYLHYWSEKGEELLISGTTIIEEHDDSGIPFFIEIVDYVPISAFEYDSTLADTVYSMVEKEPEYNGGLEKMYKTIAKNLKYPPTARRKRIQGIVYIRFIVNEKGKIMNQEVIQGVHPECDAGALEVTKLLTDWSPGLNHGKPVKVRFVLPIRFKLD